MRFSQHFPAFADLIFFFLCRYTVLDANDIQLSSSSSTSSSSSLPSSTPSSDPSTASENSSHKGLAVTLGVVCTVFGLLVLSGIWWFIRRWKRRGDDDDGFYDYPRTVNDNNHSPQMQMSDTNNNDNTPASYNYSLSRMTSSRGRERDSRFRSIPIPTPEIATITNARRNTTNNTTRPTSSSSSSKIRHHHSTSSASSSKFKNLKNPLTPIPEAHREPSLARHTSKSPMRESSSRRRQLENYSSPSLLANGSDEREEA